MKRLNRRSFLKQSAFAVGAAVTLAPHAKVLGANDDLRLAVVGFRGQGGLHLRLLRELTGVRVVALCDADRGVLERGVAEAARRGQPVEGYADVRKLLESKNVDAITTATPDHWHSLVTVWACQAGKDVYVEKPLSHNIFQGRQTVAAAQKYRRIVQWGNQNHGRHTGPIHLEREKRGQIRVVWTSLNRMRQSIGKVAGPRIPIPEGTSPASDRSRIRL